MSEQQPERGAIEDERLDQREDGLVVEPDGELDRDLRDNGLPQQEEQG